jgi:hypothetical protein
MGQCLMPNPKQMLPTHTHTHEEENRREREREREREKGERGRKKRQQPKTKKTQCQEEGLQQVQQRKGTKKDKEWGGKEKLTVNNTLS